MEKYLEYKEYRKAVKNAKKFPLNS